MVVPAVGQRTMSKEAVEAIDKHVGQLFLSFAFIDQALDFWLMDIFPVAIRANLASKMPYQLGQKVELLRKCFDRIPALAPLKDEVSALLREIMDYNEVRNTIAHGALSHFMEGPEPALVFAKIAYSKDRGIHQMEDHILSFAVISEANDRTADAVASMHKYVSQIKKCLES
jgi:hypothetical protein